MDRWRSVFCLLLALSATPPGRAETAQDFSGEWLAVDAGQERSAQGSDAAVSPGHRGSHGAGGGGRHGGAIGGAHRHAPDSPSGGAAAAVASAPRSNSRSLTIRQSDVVFDIAADGQRTVYRFDNRNNYGPAYGGTVTLTWAAPDMIIETHPDAGGSIEERYTLSADGRSLTLHVREQHGGTDSVHDVTRAFARRGTQAAAALP